MSFVKGTITTASLAAGLIALAVSVSHAQSPRPYIAVSDFDEPYAAVPPGPPSRRAPVVIDEGYYDDPAPLIAPIEVYRVLRENGFTPLGIPRQRGPVYTISAINLANGDDGRVVIDARSGRVIRFVPAWRLGDAVNRMPVSYDAPRALPPMRADLAGAPRPPAALPRVARNYAPAVVLPRAEVKPAQPAQRTAAAPPIAPAAPVAAKPAPTIQPTQDMPSAQGLE